MKHCWIRRGHRRLLVVALGWGQSDAWSQLDFGDADGLILYQWDDPAALPDLSGYESYDLIAWSFGVWAAAQLDFGVDFRHATAVNGTLLPIDDQRGIPERIFRMTVDGWQVGRSGRSFWKRMGSRRLPERDDESLIRELRFFDRWFQHGEAGPTLQYDCAIVGDRDRIIPPEHQLHAWKNLCVHRLDIPHDMTEAWPEIRRLAGEASVDKSLVARRFERSADTYDRHAVVQREMAERLLAMLPPQQDFERALEIGCGTGVFSAMLQPRCQRLFRNDLMPGDGEDYLCGDIETLALPQKLDLVAGNAVWQWLANPRNMLRKISTALKPGGWLAISSFAPGTMGELQTLLGVSLRYQPMDDFVAMCQECFDVTDIQKYERILTFQAPMDVLKHLKHTGVTAAGGQFRWTRKKLAEFDQEYRRQFPDITLTYKPVLLVGRNR